MDIRPREAYHPGMEFDLELLLAGVGLAMILEGAPYFLFAEKMPAMLRFMASQSPGTLRAMGLLAMIVGMVLIFVVRKLLA